MPQNNNPPFPYACIWQWMVYDHSFVPHLGSSLFLFLFSSEFHFEGAFDPFQVGAVDRKKQQFPNLDEKKQVFRGRFCT